MLRLGEDDEVGPERCFDEYTATVLRRLVQNQSLAMIVIAGL